MRGQISRALSQFRKSSNSQLYLVMYLLISALVADAVIVSVSDFLQDQITISCWNCPIYINWIYLYHRAVCHFTIYKKKNKRRSI